ncbi:unnamed protein product [Lathyrus sativus]|nr:unnamed protein product [Lathyrus sativus]
MNLEICNCLSTRNNSTFSSYARICNDLRIKEYVPRSMKITKLKTLWRKIKREKKRKNFRSSSHVFLYDPSSYLQNFDDGYSTDPEYVSRSFSARFAAPSKINVIEVLDDEDRFEINDESLLGT